MGSSVSEAEEVARAGTVALDARAMVRILWVKEASEVCHAANKRVCNEQSQTSSSGDCNYRDAVLSPACWVCGCGCIQQRWGFYLARGSGAPGDSAGSVFAAAAALGSLRVWSERAQEFAGFGEDIFSFC